MSTTLTVSVVVYSARGLRPRKKDKHKFCVIFGVGSCKYRTDVVEDLFDNPVFNTECDIEVDDPTLPLTFLITEKHERDILGQVTVPLIDLTSLRTNQPVRQPLQPHKKCPNAAGDLLFEAWIQQPARVAMATMTSREDDHRATLPSGLRKLKDKLTSQHSPILHRKLSDKAHKRTNSDGTVKLTMSSSCHDLSALGTTTNTTTTTTTPALNDSPRRRSVMATIGAESDMLTHFNKPEVTGVSPREGSTSGGTRVTIRGSRLGEFKEDVVGLYVCGSNILSSLEYLSSSKLVCVTKPHRACSGTVIVETQSGGRGVSLVQFTFIDTPSASAAASASSASAPSASCSVRPASATPSASCSVRPVTADSDSTSECSSSLSRSSSRGDADVLRREPSVKSDSGSAVMPASIKSALKARSTLHHSHPTDGTEPSHSDRPEVTGVSPREGPVHCETKLTIRGSNLGLSVNDIVSLSVARVNCTATLDYESPTRLTCVVGPVSAPTTGDVIVETKSGGLGISMVQFRFVDTGADEDQFTAVPYDAGESRTSSGRLSLAAPATDSPFQRVRQTPPVVEIQPMLSRKSHGKTPAPAPPVGPPTVSPTTSPRSSFTEHVQLSHEVVSRDAWLNDRISEISSELAASEDQVKKLQHENKLLRDENERMRQYMECLVSKAISSCPQILCADTSKLF